jgi:RimJ/RimL family protein N-acetyltransferase
MKNEPNQVSEATLGKMEKRVSLRPVMTDDLPIFFGHQLDPEATKLAAFPARDRDAFFAHWTTKILGNPAAVCRTILAGDHVAGYIGAWTDAASNDRLICYWIGREFWGRGIASAALSLFLCFEATRPLSACVARHNLGSIRVLEKSGFARASEDAVCQPVGDGIDELIGFVA